MLKTIPTLLQLDDLATALAEKTLSAWRTPLTIERKDDGSQVTDIDRAANRIAEDWAHSFGIGFVGEEGADPYLRHQYALYVDPLDGTSTYTAGRSEWSIVITLMKHTMDGWQPQICIIDEPVSGQRFYATKSGVHQRRRGDALPSPLPQLRTHTGVPNVSVITWPDVPYGLNRVRASVEANVQLHHHSSGNVGICGPLIALGQLQGVVYGGRCATEAAAISLMVHAADGIVTDLDGHLLRRFELTAFGTGKKIDFNLPRGMIAASSPAVAKRLTDIVTLRQRH